MSSVSAFLLIREGDRSLYLDRWAMIYRELLWGPAALVEWLEHDETYEDEPEDLDGAVIVDFDAKELQWSGMSEFESPQVQKSYQRLLENAWPGFTVGTSTLHQLSAIIGNQTATNDGELNDEEDESDDWSDRCKTVRDASTAGASDDEDDGEPDSCSNDESEFRAWLTLIDQNGKLRHRRLYQISQDLMSADTKAVQAASKMEPAEVPAEKEILEGMWIHIPNRKIGVWGTQSMAKAVPAMQKAWKGWTVHWAEGGYADQCEISGVPGVRMTDAETLAPFMGNVMSTSRFDAGVFIGAVQSSIKKTAMKVTGCLLLVMAVPFLVFGYFADRLQAAAIAYASLVVVVVILFKGIASGLKKKFSLDQFSRRGQQDKKPPVAGPLDKTQRHDQMNRLLTACGFPSLEQLQPAMSKVPNLDDLSKI